MRPAGAGDGIPDSAVVFIPFRVSQHQRRQEGVIQSAILCLAISATYLGEKFVSYGNFIMTLNSVPGWHFFAVNYDD